MTTGLVVERMRLLIEQVMAETPESQGKKRKVAKRIGIPSDQLSKISKVDGTKSNLRSDTIESVVQTMGIDPFFFFDRSVESPSYRDYIRRRRDPPIAAPHWQAFADNWARFHELSAEERDALRRMIVEEEHEIGHWSDWVPPAEWVLERRRR